MAHSSFLERRVAYSTVSMVVHIRKRAAGQFGTADMLKDFRCVLHADATEKNDDYTLLLMTLVDKIASQTLDHIDE